MPKAGPASVEFRNVSMRFGAVTAVDDVSFTIEPGKLVTLLGPSGCGKTTTLRMIAGLEIASAGQILIGGKDVTRLSAADRDVSMVFQSYALFPHMTVENNIAFGLKQDGMPKADIAARVEQMLKLVKLDKFAKRKPHQLSGGQRQRVALARSLAKRPKVLLLDEPLGALDKKLREETQFELMDLQQELGLTFVVVTHDQEEAMTMADRIAVMAHGKVVQVATPPEIYEAPNSRFVADFIGDVNIFDGTVSSAGSGIVEIATQTGFTVRVASTEPPAVGAKAGFAVRPEKIRVGRDQPACAPLNAAQGEIWDIGYLGDMTVFHVKLKDGKVIKASSLNAVRAVEDPLGYDQEVWISFDENAGVVLKD
jgi:putrescine transport system ATP-binding protein